jgi:hypothetical protein
MDESFQLRARRLLAKSRPAALDFPALRAVLAAQQAASPAARAQAVAPQPAQAPAAADPLAEIVLAGPGWRQAASAQKGCFNRAEVKRRGNEP